MNRKNNEPRREYTQDEQQQSFIGRRFQSFADRSRDPGDATTWAVVLGALMCTFLMICFSVAGQPLIALFVFILTLVWIIVMFRFGRVNVASILWGAATTESDKEPVTVVVFQSGAALALISLGSIVVDALTGRDFGWYGVLLLAIVISYLIVYTRSWLLSHH